MRFRRRLERQATASLVPMIDVVFQLVVFFMVSTTFRVTPGIELVLPASSTATPVEITSVAITVVSPDEVYVNETRVGLPDLGNVVAELEPAPDVVVLEGDRSISYELMIEVLDALRREGLTAVTLRTRAAVP